MCKNLEFQVEEGSYSKEHLMFKKHITENFSLKVLKTGVLIYGYFTVHFKGGCILMTFLNILGQEIPKFNTPFLGHPGFLSYVWLLMKAAESVLVKGSIVPGSRLDNTF